MASLDRIHRELIRLFCMDWHNHFGQAYDYWGA